MFFSWLHTNLPSPILLSIGPVNIYWYGFFYLVSILLGYGFVRWQLKKQQSDNNVELKAISSKLEASLPDFAFGLIVSGLAGARLYHVLNEWRYYWAHPLESFAIWNGGLAIHGALIGGSLFLWIYSVKYLINEKLAARSQKLKTFLWLADLIAPALLIGQIIGRWGNYFNQELFGYPTFLPWGIPIALENRPPQFSNATYFHPTFLYESIWDIVGFIALLIILRSNKKGAKQPGLMLALYLVWTSLGRVMVEIFRIDNVPMLLGVRYPLIVALCLVLLGTLFLSSTLFRKNGYTS